MSLDSLAKRLRPTFLKTVESLEYQPCRVFLSASDMKSRAITRHASADDPTQAWSLALEQLSDALGSKKPTILRADWIVSDEPMTWSEFLNLIGKTRRNYFRQGVAFDGNFELAITSFELNANALMYKDGKQGSAKCVLRPERFTEFFKTRFNREVGLPVPNDTVRVFTTEGTFISDDMKTPLLMNDENFSAEHRNVSHLDDATYLKFARTGAAYLAGEVKKSGRFIYGHYPCFDRIVPSYNTLRHFSSIFAMLDVYETYGKLGNAHLATAITRALKYGIKEFIKYRKLDDGTEAAYPVDFVGDEIKLGALGVTIVMLAKYSDLMKTKKYLPLMEALARGIMTMQNPDGSFVHVLNGADYSLKEPFRIVYYDGEAIFGLMRLYAINHDPKLREISENAFKRFIATNHWQNHDHWLSYAINELTKYQPKREYFEFGINNFLDFLPFIYHRDTQFPTLLELIMAADTMLERMKTMPEMADLLARVPLDDFYAAMESRAKNLLTGYFYPEFAMFFARPESIVGAFFIRHHAFRVRTDDVEHFLSSFAAYRRYLARYKTPPKPSRKLLESKAEGDGLFNIQSSDANAQLSAPPSSQPIEITPTVESTQPIESSPVDSSPTVESTQPIESSPVESNSVENNTSMIDPIEKKTIELVASSPTESVIERPKGSDVSFERPTGSSVIFFGGDVVLGRRENRPLRKNPFGDLKIMSDADLRIINLECVIANQGQAGINKNEGGPYYFRGRPEQVNLLTAVKLDVALTANNHSKDYGTEALLAQNELLDRVGILHVGSGKNLAEASKTLYTKVNDLIVAILSVDATMVPFAATESEAGVFYLPPDRLELWRSTFTDKIADARRHADLVLVAPHWGPNNVFEPSDQLKAIGRLLIDLGADAVIGCHSHVLHGMEKYNERPIIYDAGNLIFDSRGSGIGGAFSLVVTKRGVEQVIFTPLLIGRCYTTAADTKHTAVVDKHFLDACRKMHTEGEIIDGVLVKFTFEPPTREARALEPVEISLPRHDGVKIEPTLEPLPEWTVDRVPDEARIEPQQLGALKLVGCRVSDDCLLMRRRQMLYVETYWMIDEPIERSVEFKILGKPVLENAMPDFGAGMTHQAIDWMFPTDRWTPGVIYREYFGLRPPGWSQLVNGEVQVHISVEDSGKSSAEYIYPKRIRLQLPNRPEAVQPTVDETVQPRTAESDIDVFKREFRAKNGVMFFMLRSIKADASGLELSSLRRAELFKSQLDCEVSLLMNAYQPEAIDVLASHHTVVKYLNMYDYFQSIDRQSERAREAQLPPIEDDCRLEYRDSDMLVRRNGKLLMYCAFDADGQKLRYINYFDDGKKIRRDTYDTLGFLSRRQTLEPATALPTEVLYYRPDGSLAVKEIYSIVEGKSVLQSMELVGMGRTFKRTREAIRYWLEQLTADESKTYFLVGDRSPEYTLFYVDAKRRDRKNIFVVHQLHSLHVLADFDPMTAPTKRWYNFLTDPSLKSDAIITLTERQKTDIVKRYGLSNVQVIPHAFRERTTPPVERDPFKLVLVGRLVAEKGVDRALEAFKLVHRAVPSAVLHLCGTGAMLEGLKQSAEADGIAQAVVFEGFRHDINEVFASAALSISTSRNEGFALVVQESLQYGCPVVAFDCNYGPSDMIENDVNGYLVAVNDVEALADRIIKVLSDPELRKRLSSNSARSVEKFSPTDVAARWAKLFIELIHREETAT